ncbi:MAG: hypothetical protein U1A05_04200, partial [Alphaproteobacteria bacterium]|nr:hypothetical protein [Alphaproteobacteria bacterium]
SLPPLFALIIALAISTTAQAYYIGSITNATPHKLMVKRANFSVNLCYTGAEICPLEMKQTTIQANATHPYFRSFPSRMEIVRNSQVCPTNGIYNIILYTIHMNVDNGKETHKVTCRGDSHGTNNCIPQNYKTELAVTPTGMPLLTIKEVVH